MDRTKGNHLVEVGGCDLSDRSRHRGTHLIPASKIGSTLVPFTPGNVPYGTKTIPDKSLVPLWFHVTPGFQQSDVALQERRPYVQRHSVDKERSCAKRT